FLSIFKFTGNVVIEQDESDNSILVNVSEEIDSSTEEVAVAYYTPAPVSNETIIIEGEKRVIVSAPDEYNYTDVFVYASIYEVPGMEKVPMGSNSLQIKWYPRESVDLSLANTVSEDVEDLLVAESVEAISEEVRIVPQNELEFFDVDNDGFIDFVGWVVPHLSAQTYEIILITEASELNFNRELLRDIYGYVNALDGNYTAIAPGNFVRVTFEQELDNTKDITLYANSNGGSVEVYEKDANELLMTFENLNNFEENKLFLTNLVGVQDVFDLKVVGASVEFDYIVDPVTGCDPAGASCVDSTCDAIYLDSIPGWTWYDNWGCVDDSTGITVVNPDSLCDTFFLDGKDGDCAYYDNGDSNAHMCPSYERLSESRSVVADDCICPNGICDYNSVYNFDHEFFAGPQSINCSSPNPSINGSCSGESITYAEDASINVTANYVNSQITAQKITISSTGYVVYDNVTLYVEEFVVESGAYVEFRNGGNTVWHNGDWNISGTVVSNSETHRINVTSDDEFGINVLAGGNLTILNGTNITNGEDATSEYYFNVYGDLSLEDSYISEMTADGVYIYSGAVVNALGNITFSNNLGSSITTKEDVSLSGDLITDETCFTIAEDDVVLDGSGFNIDYGSDGISDDTGILVSGIRDNITIKNAVITNLHTTSTNNLPAVYFNNNISNSLIYNNIINVRDSSSALYFTESSIGNIIQDNSLNSSDSNSFGIYYSSGTYSPLNDIIRNNTFYGSGDTAVIMSNSVNNLSFIDQKVYSAMGSIMGNVSFSNSNYGEISFVDMSSFGSTNLYGNSTSAIIIGNNSAYVNSSISGLNKSANVTLYSPDLSGITSPVILKDGEACGSDCYNFTPLDSATV
ncbi:hypothetical protein HN777_03550, partial [Candidatus Woesearchaeota archaeon]|nr:hypothetical protein [Candidatus Woesearchaeota archaeon]